MLKERGSECGAGKTAILPEFKHSTKYVFSTFCGICTNRPPLEQNNGPQAKEETAAAEARQARATEQILNCYDSGCVAGWMEKLSFKLNLQKSTVS